MCHCDPQDNNEYSKQPGKHLELSRLLRPGLLRERIAFSVFFLLCHITIIPPFFICSGSCFPSKNRRNESLCQSSQAGFAFFAGISAARMGVYENPPE